MPYSNFGRSRKNVVAMVEAMDDLKHLHAMWSRRQWHMKW
jgi:hypothetical protein